MPPCAIDECERPTQCRGWCDLHYRRWLRHRDPLRVDPQGTKSRPLAERINERLEQCIEAPDGCLLWSGTINNMGYGVIRESTRMGRLLLAHRAVYEHLVGPIPAETLDHVCHSRSTDCVGGPSCPHRRCVRIEHLEPVTLLENIRRMPITSEQYAEWGRRGAEKRWRG